MPEQAIGVANERAALDYFCARIAELDPDVLTGWNVVDFDLSVLERIATRVHHPFNLGRDPSPLRVRKAEGYFGSGQASIPGRLVLDGQPLANDARNGWTFLDDRTLLVHGSACEKILGDGQRLEVHFPCATDFSPPR